MSIFIAIFALLLYHCLLFIFNSPDISFNLNNAIIFKAFDLMSYFKTWIILVFMPIISLLPDIAYRLIMNNYFPDPSDILNYQKKKCKANRIKGTNENHKEDNKEKNQNKIREK